MKTVIARIEGRVQGVWFRRWTQDQARSLGINGWVRNRRDGAVEALFSGTEEAVARMIELCWQGPQAAQVTEVTETAAEPPARSGFHVLDTV